MGGFGFTAAIACPWCGQPHRGGPERCGEPCRTIIAGSRGITAMAAVEAAMAGAEWTVAEVVSGGARGVDRLGEEWAARHGIPVQRFLPEWEQFGRAAGAVRNRTMANYADALVAVWDGRSPGTGHMVDTMRHCGRRVHVYLVQGVASGRAG